MPLFHALAFPLSLFDASQISLKKSKKKKKKTKEKRKKEKKGLISHSCEKVFREGSKR